MIGHMELLHQCIKRNYRDNAINYIGVTLMDTGQEIYTYILKEKTIEQIIKNNIYRKLNLVIEKVEAIQSHLNFKATFHCVEIEELLRILKKNQAKL